MWKIIGAAMTPSMTGEEAKSLFYKLRQKLGKERRLVLRSTRSGAGSRDVYVSKWFLYNDLSLADTIQPRSTTSNFKRKKMSSSLDEGSSDGSSSTRGSTATATPPLLSQQGGTSSDDSLWNTDLFRESSESDCMSPPPSKSSPQGPPADIVSKRKRDSDKANDAIEKSAKSVEAGIDKICDVMNAFANRPMGPPAPPPAPVPHQEALPPMVSGLLETIKGSLLQVPQDQQLACTIEVLQVIQKYRK